MRIWEILKESRVEYSNAKADHMRDRPYEIDPKLMDILERAAEGADVDVKIVSGGQDPVHVKGGKRVGSTSTRHDHGQAADVQIYKDGDIQLANSTIAKQFIRQCGMHGAREVGYGYKGMGDHSIHIGLSGADNVNSQGRRPKFGVPGSTGGRAWGSDDARTQGFDALQQGQTDRYGQT